MALNRCAAVFGHRRKMGEEDSCEAMEEYMIHNGELLLLKQISFGYGKESNSSNPIRILSIKEIQKITNNFDERLVLSRMIVTVYKGTLEDGRVVAVKFPQGLPPTEQIIDFFLNQVVINQIIHHKNVIKFHGCCLEHELPILVQEFLVEGSLSDHIGGRDGGNSIGYGYFSIPWSKVLKIAADISHALSYMHMALPKPVIHMDVKLSSIYLDGSFSAKLTNFGYSVSISPGKDFISDSVVGTRGYIDPEYKATRTVTEKCDVYGFGVTLIVMLSGIDPMMMGEEEGRELVTNFVQCQRQGDRILEIVHPRVLSEATSEEIWDISGIAVRCVASRGEDRPVMREVAIELKRIYLAGKQWQG